MQSNRIYIVIVLGLLGLGLTYYLAVAVVPRVLVTMTRAAPALTVSTANSYFIGGKLLAKADGKDACVVNVFALDVMGKGIAGKSASIVGMGEEVLTMMTGADGKAVFSIKSATPGQFKLEAKIDGVTVGKVVSVTFRN